MTTPRTLPGKDISLAMPYAIPPAVKLGEDYGKDVPKAYPFFYNFLNYPYQEGGPDGPSDIYSINAGDAEGPDGLEIAPANFSNNFLPPQLTVPILMNDDAHFHLLYIKFGAFRVQEFTGSITVLVSPTQVAQAIATPLTLGYSDGTSEGAPIVITAISGVTNLTIGQTYYAKNVSTTVFQLSLTPFGAAIVHTGVTGIISYRRPNIAQGSREYLLNVNGGGNRFTNTLYTAAALAAGDTIAQTAGDLRKNGDQIFIASIGTVTGLSVGYNPPLLPLVSGIFTVGYYVINANSSTFQVAPVFTSGTPIDITANGTLTYYAFSNQSESLFNAGKNARIPYISDVDVSVYMPSSGGRDLMGGFQRHPVSGVVD